MKKFLAALVVMSFVTSAPVAAFAAEKCRDNKGKFIKCPPKAAVPAKPAKCRDAKGKFTKCPA